MSKHILSFFFVLSICTQMNVKASPQARELIIIGKDTLRLNAFPIENNKTLRELVSKHIQITDKNSPLKSASNCHRGYVGIWRLEANTLYLEKIRSRFGSEPYTYLNLDGIFDKYKDKRGRIKASWFSGQDVRIIKGKWVKGFSYVGDDIWEYETICQFNNGTVTNKQNYHNYIKKASVDLQRNPIISKNFNRDLFPELANRRLMAEIRLLPNSNGQIDSLRIFMQLDDEERKEYPSDHPYMEELLRCIHLVPDWQIDFIYGKINWSKYYEQLCDIKKDKKKKSSH